MLARYRPLGRERVLLKQRMLSSRALAPAEVEEVSGYLGAKWGLVP